MDGCSCAGTVPKCHTLHVRVEVPPLRAVHLWHSGIPGGGGSPYRIIPAQQFRKAA